MGAGANRICLLEMHMHNTDNNNQHRRNQMKFNKWTLGLAAIGVVSLASAAQAEERMSALQSVLSSTTISGYVDTSVEWTLDRTDPDFSDGVPQDFDSWGRVPYRTYSKQNGFNLNVVKLTIQK